MSTPTDRPATRAGTCGAAAAPRARHPHAHLPMASAAPRPVLRCLGAALHVHPGLRRRALLVQPPSRQVQLHVERVLHRGLDRTCGSDTEITESLTLSIQIALLSHRGRDRPRHPDRLRDRTSPVPRPGGNQPADLHADGHARGRDGLVAADAVRRGVARRQLGFATITVAHIMFSISFVVVTVKARVAGLDPRLEQAAMDLYADEKTTFRKVTLPAGPARHRRGSDAGLLACRSTTSSSRTSPAARRSPSRCTSGAPPGEAFHRRPTWSGAIMFGIALIVVLVPEILKRFRKSRPGRLWSARGRPARILSASSILSGEVRSCPVPCPRSRQSGEHSRVVARCRASVVLARRSRRAPEPRPPLAEHLRCDLLGRRWWLHRAVDGAAGQGGGPVARRRRSSRASGSAGRRRDATVASSLRASPTDSRTASTALPMRCPRCCGWAMRISTRIEKTIARYGIDAQWERNGELTAAYAQWQVDELGHYVEQAAEYGVDIELWDATGCSSEVHSPTYLGGLHEPEGTASSNPAPSGLGAGRCCREPRRPDLRAEQGRRSRRRRRADGRARPAYGQVRAPKVALATNVFPNLVKRARPYVIPVWDYVLMTEPLSGRADGLDRLARPPRRSATPATSSTTTGSPPTIGSSGAATTRSTTTATASAKRWPSDPSPSSTLAGHFFSTFPQLEGVALQPPLGRSDRHVARASAPSGGRPTAARSPTCSGTPASGSAPPGSVPRSCSTS